jgi:hypothetical protein
MVTALGLLVLLVQVPAVHQVEASPIATTALEAKLKTRLTN